jgi:Protein of unknown function (DUF4089)
MKLAPEAVEAYVDATAAALGLALAPEHREGVLRYMNMVMAFAPTVMEVPLKPADESGNVFQPVPASSGSAGESA